VFREERLIEQLPAKVAAFTAVLETLRDHPHVIDIRQCGLIAGIEIGKSKEPREKYPTADRMGVKVCLTARKHALLTRPVVNTLVLMPPLCATKMEMRQMASALRAGIDETCGSTK
jgi:adenosylmethionine-8-amino-7-oxononanoate aminotransferase